MTLLEQKTEDLMNVLQSSKEYEVKEYLEQYFSQREPTFSGYVDMLLKEKQLRRQDVLIRANLPQKYGYKLLSGETHTTNRDKILRICFSMEMSLKETQRALKLYGMNELYPKIKRDVLLIVALGQKMYDIDQVNDMLKSKGFAPLYDAEFE